MHSTKSEILALLKRSDGGTVDELSSALGLASMTVRQHLIALERDGAVSADEVRRATGRPHYRFRLTQDGHRRVSDGYDRMLALLVDQAGRLEPADVAGATPDERRARLFRLAAEALADRHRPELRALSGPARIQRVAEVLRSHGGFAEWHDLGTDYELRDFSCVFRSTLGNGMPCAWHESFLASALETDIRTADEPSSCAACCRYLVAATALARPSRPGVSP